MSEPTTPLLPKPDAITTTGDNSSWWNKLLDYEEAKNQMLFSLPMIITNVAYYSIPLVSVMFAGHLGEVELAAANLANSWATVTGLSFETWRGFSMEAFNHVFVSLKLALPSAAMVCLEYWAFELLVLLAGLFPNSEITTSLIAMCTRVSNELGARNINKAKHAMGVTLKLSVILALVVVLALGFGHNIWAGFFSDSPVIISSYASMTPLLVISIILDSIQGVLSGVARGCGWQHLALQKSGIGLCSITHHVETKL
nr:protein DETOXIFICATION 19-like [Tanacetum cinerariifolium]